MSWAVKPSCSGFRTLDSEAQIGLVEGLLNPEICSSWNVFHFLEQRRPITPVPVQVVSHNCTSMGAGKTKVQNLADHVGWQECEGCTRELFWERQTKLVNVVVRGMVIDIQRHKNVGIRCPTGPSYCKTD